MFPLTRPDAGRQTSDESGSDPEARLASDSVRLFYTLRCALSAS